MASPSSPQHEPTMEEILASIRKIISEDSTEAPQQAAPAPVAPAPQPVARAPEPEPEADVLELTHEIEEIPEPAPMPAPVMAPPPPRPTDDIVFQSIEEAPEVSVAPAPVHSGGGFVSEKARGAIDDALAGLDFGPEEHAASSQPVAPVSGLSVEGVFERAVRESFEPVLRDWLHDQADVIVERMKPVIREWMEDNLPAMLKTAVEAEVARAVRARSKR